jgi:hypothetical protein
MDSKHLPGGYHDPDRKTQVPVLWSWDHAEVIGTATVHADGQIDILIIPSLQRERIIELIRKGAIRTFSVSTGVDMNKATVDDLPWTHLQRGWDSPTNLKDVAHERHEMPWTRKGGIPWQRQGVKTGEGLADKLQARVDEWAPVREFIKKEAEPYMENQKCITDDEGNCISHAKDESCPKDRKVETIGQKACRLVYEYVKARLEKTDTHVKFNEYDVYIVWFSKTLQNWKALLSTNLPDGMYYEVTYNGDQHETYIDAYKKFDNVCIKDPDVGVHIPMVDSD